MIETCQICLFAYNEEKNILRALDSIFSSNHNINIQVTVVANGCTDNTAEIVKKYSQKEIGVKLIEIMKGDKSNAWNIFVHESRSQGNYYIFADGDLVFSNNAFSILCDSLRNNPKANIVAGVPLSGKNIEKTILETEKDRGVYGGLYAISKNFLDRIRQQKIKIPVGIIGDDGMVGAYAKFNLDFIEGNWKNNLIVVERNAGFYYDTLSVFDIKQYINRLYRYSLRKHQNLIIRHLLNNCNIGKNGGNLIPASSHELYQKYFHIIKIEWRGLNTFFDIITYLSIRKAKKLYDKKKT